MIVFIGMGAYSARQAIKKICIWFIITIFAKNFAYASYSNSPFTSLLVNLMWNITLFVFYSLLWLLPSKTLFRRPAAINYARFWCIFRIWNIACLILNMFSTTESISVCMEFFGSTWFPAIGEPIVLYFTLLRDSYWWQGFLVSGSDTQVEDGLQSPLEGIDLGLKSAQILAESLDNMERSIGMKSKKTNVRLLNFAFINLDKSKRLGTGSFSKVFLGKYKNEEVAIKLIFTVDLTKEVIHRAAVEAQILSSIVHPNIVRIFGVSVLPPSVCIVLEYCQFGSLADVVQGTGIFELSSTKNDVIPKFKLSIMDRLTLAIGCAKGLNALHSFCPDLCHRDVKSFNFLVDHRFNAKIADLELGTTEKVVSKDRDDKSKFKEGLSLDQPIMEKECDYRHEEVLANWLSPEVIRDGRYSQKSDIYSFSLVLWELLSGCQPFQNVRKQENLRSKILQGKRPEIPDKWLDENENIFPFNFLISIITRGWQEEPHARPTSLEILSELEALHRFSCQKLIIDTDLIPDLSSLKISSFSSPSKFSSPWRSSTAVNSLTNVELNQAAVANLALPLQTDSDYELLDRDLGAWVLCSIKPPYYILRTTENWCRLFGNHSYDVVGRPLWSVIAGEKTEENILQTLNTELNDLVNRKIFSTHSLLTLYQGLGKTYYPFSSQYTVNFFPIKKRSYFKKNDIEVEQNDSSRSSSFMQKHFNSSASKLSISFLKKKSFSSLISPHNSNETTSIPDIDANHPVVLLAINFNELIEGNSEAPSSKSSSRSTSRASFLSRSIGRLLEDGRASFSLSRSSVSSGRMNTFSNEILLSVASETSRESSGIEVNVRS
jgi:serine/threonine-protein kinase TNNI3K